MTFSIWRISPGLVSCWLIACPVGCQGDYREDLDYSYAVEQSWAIESLGDADLIQFESVPLDPFDVSCLRAAIVDDNIAAGRDVLLIGSGTGLIALLCLLNDGDVVVATDAQPAAVANTSYNVAALAPDFEVEARLRVVGEASAFSSLESDEQFDLIIAHLDRPESLFGASADAKGLDQRLEIFLDNLVSELPSRTRTGGRCILLCNTEKTINGLKKAIGRSSSLELKSLDDRSASDLTSPFAPAMMWEVRRASTPAAVPAVKNQAI